MGQGRARGWDRDAVAVKRGATDWYAPPRLVSVAVARDCLYPCRRLPRQGRSAVSPSRHWLLACGVVLLSASAVAAEDDRWNKIDLKPLVAPVVPLPPNAQVAPGGFDQTPPPGYSAPAYNSPSSQLPNSTGGGIKLTIPSPFKD